MRQVGDRLGRYTLLKRLAVGGMGEVFVAAKPGPVGFGPYVALKILRDELACDPQFVDMLVDEANISMFLNHQNVVSVLDLSEDNGAYYIAMEYVQGITVERLVDALAAEGDKLDLPHTLYIAVELCRALKYAHTRVNHKGEPLNIVHRDVTPANILLSTQGEVKLTDFGIARARGRIHTTQAGVLKGKFGYMAPEMVRYEQIDGRADLFCAGVVMYLMMSGRHPVAGAAVMEAIRRFEQKRIPPPSHFNSDIPAVLDTIVMRALEPQPEQRWGSAAALGDALRDVMLQNPEWRKHAKDGGQRLVRIMRRIAPEEFEAPVEAETVARLQRQLNEDPLAPFPRAITTETEPPTDGSLPVLDHGGGDKAARSVTDLETDENIHVHDVRSVQAQLLRERAASAVVDLLDDVDSGADTAASPVAEPPLVVDFPDGSNAHRAHSDLLAEPALPADGLDGPKTDGGFSERTESGFAFDDFEEGVIDRPLRPDTDRDERTIVNSPTNGFDHEDVVAAATVSPSTKSEQADDSKTVAGTFVPADGQDAAAGRAPSANVPKIIGPTMKASAAAGDPSTVIPALRRNGRNGETDDHESAPTDDPPPDRVERLADATLLEGLDGSEAKQPGSARLAGARSGSVETPEMAEGDPALDAVTIEAQPGDIRAGVLDRALARAWGADESQQSGDDLLPPPMRNVATPRSAESAPLRLVMSADGEIVPPPADGAPQTAASPASFEPDLEGPEKPTFPQSFMASPSTSQSPERVVQRTPEPRPDAWASSEASTQRPSLDRVGAGMDMGTNTSRWVAGEIDANVLSWDDEAAARRAVATRGQANPAHDRSHPSIRAARPVYTVGSFWERNGMLVGTMLVAFVLLGGLVYAIMFTQVFWPRLKLSSEPPGAIVLVDGVQAPGRTPLVVQVEPQRRHRIEFRLEGYQRTLREITEGIGRAKTYTLTVSMARLPPRLFLPVQGRVMVNGEFVGRGREVSLDVSRLEGPVTLRVEAAGHEPYEVSFDAVAEIPPSLDVPLRKRSNK